MTQLEVVTESAYAQIAEFLAGFDPGDHPSRTSAWWITRMRHWWDDNPALSAGLHRGFVIVHAGRVVGFLGIVPGLVDTPEGTRSTASTSTWRVLPEYRKFSLELLSRMLALKAYVHFNTTPIEMVIPIMRGFKFVTFPGSHRHHESLFILDAGAVAAAAVRREVPALGGMAGLIGKTVGQATRVGLAVSGRIRQPKARFPGCTITRAGTEVDTLWQKSSLRGFLTGVRTSAVVNWLAFGNSNMPKKLVVCYDNSQLVGVAVLGRRDNRDVEVFECIDMFMREESAETVESLIAAAGEAVRASGGACVAFPHFTPFLARCYRELGFRERGVDPEREWMRLEGGRSPENIPSYLTHMHGDRWL
jgi:hypothetical protein